ncbi:hypothetical protein [Lysobacter enzymogenes]|uniref:Secreted protein n=1 Tax=Lysobacter enzymogenes TaxID=69 RepID=A0AAU9AYA2_LYSEN|nr:hypothetical protein [Lysobacter enzymogenes]BAV98321.1 conserved hypothetical protein [Lysobacter enzymogenes]
MNCKSRILGSSLGLLLILAPHADAQKRRAQPPAKDNATHAAAMARSAETCPEHSDARTRPGVAAVPAAALKVLESRGYALCPDTRLDTTTPVVWYGKQGVFAWNPSSAGAIKVLAAQAAAFARSEEFPPGTVVWRANGKLAEGALVPAFRRR